MAHRKASEGNSPQTPLDAASVFQDGSSSAECSTSSRESAAGSPRLRSKRGFHRRPVVTDGDLLVHYRLGETIGKGGFAVVKEGWNSTTGSKVAVKIIDRTKYPPESQSLEREVELLAELRHPHCIRLHECHVTPNRVYLVLELATGGDLLEHVMERGHYNEEDSSIIIGQLLKGVAYLHSKGIVHRDLKLENILFEGAGLNAIVKIADFGVSKSFKDEILVTMCGSPQYVAPEILAIGPKQASYSRAVDMWSIGVILYILLCGFSPFDDEDDQALFQKIKEGDYTLTGPHWDHISEEAKDLVASLLCVDPEVRMTAEEALQQAWLTPDWHEHVRLARARRRSYRNSRRNSTSSSDSTGYKPPEDQEATSSKQKEAHASPSTAGSAPTHKSTFSKETRSSGTLLVQTTLETPKPETTSPTVSIESKLRDLPPLKLPPRGAGSPPKLSPRTNQQGGASPGLSPQARKDKQTLLGHSPKLQSVDTLRGRVALDKAMGSLTIQGPKRLDSSPRSPKLAAIVATSSGSGSQGSSRLGSPRSPAGKENCFE